MALARAAHWGLSRGLVLLYLTIPAAALAALPLQPAPIAAPGAPAAPPAFPMEQEQESPAVPSYDPCTEPRLELRQPGSFRVLPTQFGYAGCGIAAIGAF